MTVYSGDDLFDSATPDLLVKQAEESYCTLWLLLCNLDQEYKARLGDSVYIQRKWLSVDFQHKTLYGVIEISQMPRLSELIWFDIIDNHIFVQSKNLPRDPTTGLKQGFSVPEEIKSVCELLQHTVAVYFSDQMENSQTDATGSIVKISL